MAINYVKLSFIPGVAWAGLRDLCGCDEQLVDDTDTGITIRLLDRLLVDEPRSTLKPGSAITLTAADRDRLLAAVYTCTYGSRVAGTLTCQACAKPFDLNFNLPDLVSGIQPAESPVPVQQNGYLAFELADKRRFRLPTGEDEFAVWLLPARQAEQELLRRCVVSGDPLDDPAALQTAMRAVAPVVDLDLEARCPECEAEQSVHFDLQNYLLSMLKAEQPRLAQEVHQLAIVYGWGLNEILGLTRTQRRTHVSMIQAETARNASRISTGL